MSRFGSQEFLKIVTRVFEQQYGDAYPQAVGDLKAAWNNDDPALDERAWTSLQSIGTIHAQSLIVDAKQERGMNDWLTQLVNRRN